jgi:hypothetical protein
LRSQRANGFSIQQQLIIACHRLDAESVVRCLRDGATVNGVFGESADDSLFQDPWTGGFTPIGAETWTALMATASAPEYPDPPAGHDRLWESPELVQQLQEEVSKETLEKRRDAEITIAQILLSHKPDINRADSHGATALYMAVDADKPRLVRLLLEYKANPNTRTGVYIDGPGNSTPLHRAFHSPEVYQLLIDHGADPTAKDGMGNMPKNPLQ